MKKRKHIKSDRKGFTLIELLIAMAITGFIGAAIFTTYQSQQKSYIVQDLVTDMQQNLRAATNIMVRDIRMAGCDPKKSAVPTIVTAGPNSINITMDLSDPADGDCGDAGEDITYGFSNANDADSNGIADAGAADLGRDTGGGFQPIAENIEAIGFAYAYSANATTRRLVTSLSHVIWAVDTDSDNNWDNLDFNGDGDIDADDNGTSTATGTAVNTSQIRAVRIWILARVEKEDPDFVNRNTYVVGAKLITPNDGFRRRLMVTTVQCRNMGL